MADTMRLIKKYPNRRLYDTQTSSYITLADVRDLVIKREEFQVVDAKSGEDLTRAILLQIILEAENAGMPMFSHDVLAEFIRLYGNAMQGFMGNYIERSVQSFLEIQKRFQEQSQRVYGDPNRLNQELWSQFFAFQGPAMQNMLTTYLEQSQSMFAQMQDQFAKQTRTLFGGIGMPGFGPPASGAAAEAAARAEGESDKSKS